MQSKMCIDAFDLFSTKIKRQMYEYIKDFDELELEMKCLRLYAHDMLIYYIQFMYIMFVIQQ